MGSTANYPISVILPCKNEAENLRALLPKLKACLPDAEILVVDDGSTDASAAVCREQAVRVVSHPHSLGNGAAIKTGARQAKGSVFVFMDADGQHDPADIPRMLDKLDEGFDMVVGARHSTTQATIFRRFANGFYNRLASLMTGFRIQDLTSGFRAVRARHFVKFLYLLPNGFSYPTTITMAFFRSGLPVAYVPIRAEARGGKSHIRLLHDGTRFFVIILKIGALFSPMRLFLPIALGLFGIGVAYYGYTYLTAHRFTNMSALLIIVVVFDFFDWSDLGASLRVALQGDRRGREADGTVFIQFLNRHDFNRMARILRQASLERSCRRSVSAPRPCRDHQTLDESSATHAATSQWLVLRRERTAFAAAGAVLKDRVLDIGCADKPLRPYLNDEVQYLGLDYYATAKQLYDTQPDVYGDGQCLPFPDASFDGVALLDVLEHLPNPANLQQLLRSREY